MSLGFRRGCAAAPAGQPPPEPPTCRRLPHRKRWRLAGKLMKEGRTQ